MKLLHRSKYFAVHQCERMRCFLFESENKSVWLSFCQLLALRQKVKSMDLQSHFEDEGNTSGIEILVFCNCEHVLILDTYLLIDLKEFVANMFSPVNQSCGLSMQA